MRQDLPVQSIQGGLLIIVTGSLLGHLLFILSVIQRDHYRGESGTDLYSGFIEEVVCDQMVNCGIENQRIGE